MVDTDTFGGTVDTLLLNHLSQLRVETGTTGNHYLFVPLMNLEVSENMPESRVNMRQQRVYVQSAPDVELSFGLHCTSDILEEIYSDKVGQDNTVSRTTVPYIPPKKTWQFTTKDTADNQNTVTVDVEGVLLSRSVSQSADDVGGSLTANLRIRVTGTSIAVAKTTAS